MKKKSEHGELTPRERIFCELIADHTDGRNISEKAEEAGYAAGRHGYVVLKRDDVSQEIERLVDANIRVIRARRGAVLAAVADRAEKDSSADARTFLQATGDIQSGVNQQVNVVQSTNGELAGRIQKAQEERAEAKRIADKRAAVLRNSK